MIVAFVVAFALIFLLICVQVGMQAHLRKVADDLTYLYCDERGALPRIGHLESRVEDLDLAKRCTDADIDLLRGRLDAHAAGMRLHGAALRSILRAEIVHLNDQAVASSRARTELAAQLGQLDDAGGCSGR